jgi:SAM-dependent methyltransferase
VIRSTSETVVVDIGCGTADIADYLDFASYTGFDPNPPYVEQAAQRLSERATVFVAGVGDPTLAARLPKSADVVLMMGVLHHLDDDLVNASLQLASALIGSEGRFVAFDPGIVDGQPRIAKALIARDRGQHVRTVESTGALLRAHFTDVTVTVHHDFLSVPYTHLVAHGSNPSTS